MITIRRADERGLFDHGWLKSAHTFSFASYFDPKFTGFGDLIVINQDWIAPSRGFGTHGHKDMEIVTVVLSGVLEHKDNMGNGSRLYPGEVQFMSAGTGVTHSEFNGSSSEELHMLQMWVRPERKASKPRYEQKAFEQGLRKGRFCLVVSPDGEAGSLTIGQDARLYSGMLDGDEVATLEIGQGRCAWLHLAGGELLVNGEALGAGDGAAIDGGEGLTLSGGTGAKFVLWELAAKG